MSRRYLILPFFTLLVVSQNHCQHRQFESTDSDPEKLIGGNESIGDYAFKHNNMTVGDFIGLKPKEIALTLDDGPKPGSEKLAQTLADMGVPVTYFMIGQNARKNLGIVKTIANLKFKDGTPATIIANHSWDHKGPTGKINIAYNAASAIDDIYDADEVLAPFIIEQGKPFLFRAPGGNFFNKGNKALDEVNKKLSRYIGPFRWDVSGDAGSCVGATACLESYEHQIKVRGAKHGVVVLAHDVIDSTRVFIPQLVKKMQAQNYKFVALDKYPDKLAKFGTVPENEMGLTEVTLDAKVSPGGYLFEVGVKNAARINVYIEGSETPFLTSNSSSLTAEKKLSQLGTRQFLVKGYDAKGQLIAKGVRFGFFAKDKVTFN